MSKLNSEQEHKLIESAKDLVPGLMEYIVSYGKELQERARCPVSSAEGDNIKLANDLFIEALYYVLHVVDRLVLQTLGVYKRSLFMDNIFQTISDGLSKTAFSGEAFAEGLNNYQTAYSKFKFYPEDNNKILADVLYWEFAKRIVTRYGDQNPATIMSISYGALLVIKNLQDALDSHGLNEFV